MTSYTWTTVDTLYGPNSDKRFGTSIDFNSDGTIMAVGAIYQNSTGAVFVYQYSNETWSQLGSTIYGEASIDWFGASVALSSDGTILAVGAPKNDGTANNAGSVRVFQYSNSSWTQIGSDIDAEAQDDLFGTSVALSSDGTILAVGAPNNTNNSRTKAGSVRVFQYSNSSWTQIGSDIDGEAQYDDSGISVALSSDGTILAVGADTNDGTANNAGSVRVFQYSNSSWTQIGSDIDGELYSEKSGISVSLSSDGTILAAGAWTNSTNGTNSGCARVYQYSSGSWTQIGSNIYGDASLDTFGLSVALSSNGTILAACSLSYARVYQYSSGSWSLIGASIADSTSTLNAVALNSDGNILAIANPYTSSSTISTAGSVVVLESGMVISSGTTTLTAGSTVSTLTGGDLSVTGDSTVSTVSSSTSTITIGSTSTLSIKSGTHSGTLSGSGSLKKTGTGTLTLGGSNSSYSGSVNVNGGKISLTNSTALGSGSVSLGSSSTSTNVTLEMNTTSSSTLSNNISILGTGENLINNSGSGTSTLAGVITKNGTTVTLGGALNVTGGILGSSSNSDVIVGTTTYPGDVTYAYGGTYSYNGPTTVTSGTTLTIEGGVSVPNSDVTIESGATLELDYTTSGSPITVKSLILNGTMIVNITANLTAGSSYNIIEYGSKSGSTTSVTINYTGSNYSSVNLSGAFGASAYAVTVTSAPTSDICFPAKTPILTNQGYINIEEIDPSIHTIRNKKIVAITKTVSHDKHLVCIAKNALGMNYPDKTTYISKNHQIFYKGQMFQAKQFVDVLDKVTLVPYNGEILYNVLLKDYEKMQVNNLIVETLHPHHKVARLYCLLDGINVSSHHKLITIFNKWDRDYRQLIIPKLSKKNINKIE
jgi:hypothetical protein